jgi:hypothetical protein
MLGFLVNSDAYQPYRSPGSCLTTALFRQGHCRRIWVPPSILQSAASHKSKPARAARGRACRCPRSGRGSLLLP